jgi:hypothetical protein
MEEISKRMIIATVDNFAMARKLQLLSSLRLSTIA